MDAVQQINSAVKELVAQARKMEQERNAIKRDFDKLQKTSDRKDETIARLRTKIEALTEENKAKRVNIKSAPARATAKAPAKVATKAVATKAKATAKTTTKTQSKTVKTTKVATKAPAKATVARKAVTTKKVTRVARKPKAEDDIFVDGLEGLAL